jgi:hypothetical protein
MLVHPFLGIPYIRTTVLHIGNESKEMAYFFRNALARMSSLFVFSRYSTILEGKTKWMIRITGFGVLNLPEVSMGPFSI